MIKHVNGDILKASEYIICHQVNCQGVMGSGLAKQIRDKYPVVYNSYKKHCKESTPEILLGQSLLVRVDNDKVIANLFSQLNYGKNRRQTDYNALDRCLERVMLYASEYNVSVAIPYNLGCGLAGGDWNTVYKLIEKYFLDSDIECIIYKL